MRKSRFSETQIVGILRDAGAACPCRTCYGRTASARRHSSSGGASTGAVGIGCATTAGAEAEHAKLKRMYADLALEHAAIKDVLHRKL